MLGQLPSRENVFQLLSAKMENLLYATRPSMNYFNEPDNLYIPFYFYESYFFKPVSYSRDSSICLIYSTFFDTYATRLFPADVLLK